MYYICKARGILKNFLKKYNLFKRSLGNCNIKLLKSLFYRIVDRFKSSDDSNNILSDVIKNSTIHHNKTFLISIFALFIISFVVIMHHELASIHDYIKEKVIPTTEKIEEIFKNYESSLSHIGEIIVNKDIANNPLQVSELLKSVYNHNKNYAHNVIWYNSNNIAIGISGLLPNYHIDDSLIEKLNQSDNKNIIGKTTHYYDYNKKIYVNLYVSVMDKNGSKGLLFVPINLLDLIGKAKIDTNINNDIYKIAVKKIGGSIINPKNSDDYKFIETLPLDNLPFEIVIGYHKASVFYIICKKIMLSFVYIALVGMMMIYSYNLAERRKGSKTYNELFADKVKILKKEKTTLVKNLSLSIDKNNKNELLLNASIKATQIRDELLDEISKNNISSLKTIKECNMMILNHATNQSDVTIDEDRLVRLFNAIDQTCDDLENNIVSRNNTHNQEDSNVDIEEAINKALMIFQYIALSKNIIFKTEFELSKSFIDANSITFKQIIISLIASSIKALPNDSIIEIKSYIDQDENLIINIEDNGFGMDSLMKERIFNKDKISLMLGAIELDLNVVENLVKYMFNGRMKIESRLRNGTKIMISLPLFRDKKNTINTNVVNFPSKTTHRL